MTHPAPPTPLKIGELARATGVSIRAIRHYDDHGLLTSTRSGNGYRAFQPVAITQVRQIQRLIATGFSLEEIRSFPDCMRLIEGAKACKEISETQRKRLAALEQQIADLERRRARLRSMLMEDRDATGDAGTSSLT
ncbi:MULTISPECIES: MerR family transcriptional regulator [Pandoraea]|uniref:MerR family transcriptional regulator n=1 Tax=Pandoraea TaxID=93217 RepID=UPI001F5DB13A|nr:MULTISPECIES: MerR family transcriptional regulator [Pandoraea]MCI3208518.1 MerR family transcriptional regulator [Pandoraea sp. LA3]MDN4586547.1 MerR family transcriptional regulator [Pandoraea capi]